MNIKEITDFWNEWYFDEDACFWRKYIKSTNLEWFCDIDPNNLPEDFKANFKHYNHHSAMIDAGWDFIRSLPASPCEKNSQDWQVEYIKIVPEDVNLIIVVFRESNYDIYREWLIFLEKEGKKYNFFNLSHEYI